MALLPLLLPHAALFYLVLSFVSDQGADWYAETTTIQQYQQNSE